VEIGIRWRNAAAGWTAFILVAVAIYQGVGQLQRALEFAARYEAVHIVAHSILYGTLSALCMLAVRRVHVAVLITACVGAAQEAVQCIFARRPPGSPELFDLMVDSIAAALAASVVFGWVLQRRFTLRRSVRAARR